ncbi:MAG: 6-phosphogluconolactonase [Candidatus Acidiferrales bacterium]
MIREARVFSDANGLTHAVAEESLRIAEDSVGKEGRCAICLSGGTTPRALNELWARDYAARMPWKEIHLFWGDERYIPPEDERSNYRMVRESLITHVPVPPANIHPMPTHFEHPDDAAKDYEAKLRKFFGAVAAFDLLFLGVGPEGHTASLFPGSPALGESQRWVLAVKTPADPPTRLTLTYPVINRAKNVFFLAEGPKKRDIVQTIRHEPDGDSSAYPAARVHSPGRVIWFLDQSAAF